MPEIAKKHFNDTIQENIIIFKNILKFLYNLNNKIKIYTLLIPRYYTIENIHKTLYSDWKEEFEGIIHSVQKEYEFDYVNYKHYLPISKNNNFYADVNATGAIAFTSLLNERIKIRI